MRQRLSDGVGLTFRSDALIRNSIMPQGQSPIVTVGPWRSMDGRKLYLDGWKLYLDGRKLSLDGRKLSLNIA